MCIITSCCGPSLAMTIIHYNSFAVVWQKITLLHSSLASLSVASAIHQEWGLGGWRWTVAKGDSSTAGSGSVFGLGSCQSLKSAATTTHCLLHLLSWLEESSVFPPEHFQPHQSTNCSVNCFSKALIISLLQF